MDTHHGICFRIYDRTQPAEIFPHTSGVRAGTPSFSGGWNSDYVQGMQMDKENTMNKVSVDVQRLERDLEEWKTRYSTIVLERDVLQKALDSQPASMWEETFRIRSGELERMRGNLQTQKNIVDALSDEIQRLNTSNDIRFKQALENGSQASAYKAKLDAAHKMLETIYLAAKNHLSTQGNAKGYVNDKS